MAHDLHVQARRDLWGRAPAFQDVFQGDDRDRPLIPPVPARLHEYRPVQLPLPAYRQVSDRSRFGVLLDDVSSGAEKVGIAIAGALGNVGVQEDSSDDDSEDDKGLKNKIGNKKPAKSAGPQVAGVEEDSDDELVGSKVVHTGLALPFAPELAAAAGVSLGVAGVARLLKNQVNHGRQVALEFNAEARRKAAFDAEMLIAQDEIQRLNAKGANEDSLKHKQADHQFIEAQLKLRNEIEKARIQGRGEAYIATLEAELQYLKDRDKAELDRLKVREEAAVVVRRDDHQHVERQLAVKARLFENAQQLTAQVIETTERMALDAAAKRAQQATLEKEYQLEVYGAALQHVDKQSERAAQIQAKAIATLSRALKRKDEQQVRLQHDLVRLARASQGDDFLDDVDEALPIEIGTLGAELKRSKFKHKNKENGCLDGVDLYQLLTGQDGFNEDATEAIQFALEAALKLHLARLARQGQMLSRQKVVTELLAESNEMGLKTLEFFNFIRKTLLVLPSEKSRFVLNKIYLAYTRTYQLLKG